MALVPLNPQLHSLASHATPRVHSIPCAPWTPIYPSSPRTPSHHSGDTAPLLRYPLTPHPISLCSKEHSRPQPLPSVPALEPTGQGAIVSNEGCHVHRTLVNVEVPHAPHEMSTADRETLGQRWDPPQQQWPRQVQ